MSDRLPFSGNKPACFCNRFRIWRKANKQWKNATLYKKFRKIQVFVKSYPLKSNFLPLGEGTETPTLLCFNICVFCKNCSQQMTSCLRGEADQSAQRAGSGWRACAGRSSSRSWSSGWSRRRLRRRAGAGRRSWRRRAPPRPGSAPAPPTPAQSAPARPP